MIRFFLCAIGSMLLWSGLTAEDWPQWRGVHRDGRSGETGLLKSWPQSGPRQLWHVRSAGSGYSGPAIVGDRLYLLGLIGDAECALCLSLQDGKEIWKTAIGKPYRNSFGDGPRSTPTIDGARAYVLGAHGDLACLDSTTGKVVWSLNILQEFGGSNITWGISESPLIEKDLVIVTPGGAKATMAALDKSTGKTRWTSRDSNTIAENAGYASPIVYDVNGERQIATFTSKGAYAASAADGQFLWRYDKVANDTANIATPIFHAGQIYFTSDYGTGGALLSLEPGGKAKEVYFNRNMKNHHGGVVLVNGALYGYNSSQLTCLDWATGRRLWQDRSVGKGSIAYADGMLYLFSEDGTVGLAVASPQGYREVSRFNLPHRTDRPTWTHPVISGGKLLLRDQENLYCYDVRGS